ncbi:MAG: hypothetical protein M3044_12915 [Thermoproteota archaeon]|nr:hypothetical protein [Thermoproteota archaeon]
MKANKTVVVGILAAVVVSMIFVAVVGVTNASAQSSNVSSSKAAAEKVQ